MQEDVIKKEQGHDVSIALIQRDIEYMKNSVLKIETTLAVFDRNFARKDELTKIEELIKETQKNTKVLLDSKVDKEDFDPIKKTLQKVNWLMIAVVVGGLLSLIIQVGS